MPNAATIHIASGESCVAQESRGLEAAADARELERECDELAQALRGYFPEASLELSRHLHDVADDRALEPTFRLNGIVAAERSHEVIEDWVDQRVDGWRFDGCEFDDQTRELRIRERSCSSIQIRPAFGISFALSGLIAWVPREVQRRGDGDKQSSPLQCSRLIAENREEHGPPCKQLDPAKGHGQAPIEARQSQAIAMSETGLNYQVVTIKDSPSCWGGSHYSPIELYPVQAKEAWEPTAPVLIVLSEGAERLWSVPPTLLRGFLREEVCLPWSVPCEQVGGVGANILSQADSAAHMESEDVAGVHIPGDTTTPPAPDAVWVGSGDA